MIFQGNFDRLNIRFDHSRFQIVLGRQALTWGVSYFWPALDLFAPFTPEQIDREYKAGIDAVRVIIPLGSLSEVEFLGAVLGPSFHDDASFGALLRWNVGSADIGFMAGSFHQDTVVGGFVTANVLGTGVRGEIAWTDSGDPTDVLRERRRFWRGSVGVDRQLTPSLNLVSELAWNGYGTSETRLYPLWLISDRVLRGEVNGLARLYAGLTLTWLAHPLFTVSGTSLINWDDGSVMLVPNLLWSLGDNTDAILGGQFGFGEGLQNSLIPQSEYGSVPDSLFGSVRFYF
jgi:hypothetical protein